MLGYVCLHFLFIDKTEIHGLTPITLWWFRNKLSRHWRGSARKN